MASRLTCHHPNKGEFEFGKVSVKGCCGKVRWNTVRQGDIWINGLFCEDEFLTSSFNSSVISGPTAPESSANEHSEVDWIAKEIAFQELICNDRSSHWSDGYPGKEHVKEEHEVDIISTLTAVAALFRDWCMELPEPLMPNDLDGLSSLKEDNQDEWIWINDPKLEVNRQLDFVTHLPLQNEMLRWSGYDRTWDEFIKDRLKSQHVSHQAFAPHGFAEKGSLYDTHLCDKIQGKEELQSSMNPIQQIGVTSHYQDASPEGQVDNESLQEVTGELEDGMGCFVHTRMSDQYVMFGSQSPAVSRYSFCDPTGLGETSGKGDLVNDHIFAETLYSIEHAFDTTWCTPKAGDVLPPIMAEEMVVGDLSFEKDLPANGGVPPVIDMSKMKEDDSNRCALMHGPPPLHEALPFALSYMGLRDLLMMEKVCKFFKEWIRNDVLLWKQLHVEPPLSKSLTDEVLLELATRSKGQLQCLNLVDCTRLTEMAVEQVVAMNPRLIKLCLPGCSRISADSVVRMVEMLTDRSHSGSGLKQLRIRNIYGLTREHLASLQNMIGARAPHQASSRKPQYYHNGHHGSLYDDDRPIDVEECPKCTNVRLVYDCTRERCQQKQGLECRACFLCTVRCEECGRCISDSDYEETFSLDLLCSCCWLRLPKCTECSRPGCGRHADHYMRVPAATFVRDVDRRG